jgi:N-acyl homoserine lactone hydrolase
VRLLWTPGHTLGHQSILLALAGRDLLLTGDAAYTRRTIDDDLVPIFVADQRLYLRSLTAIRDHLRRAPDTVVICGHDAQRLQRLEPIYA